MIATVLFAALATSPNVSTRCDAVSINQTLRRISIADYEPPATPPPPAASAALYARASGKVADCAKSSQHFMDTAVQDYLHAADLATFSGRDYLAAREPSQACAEFRKAESYFTAAHSARPSRHLDVLMLQAEEHHRAALSALMQQHCRGGRYV